MMKLTIFLQPYGVRLDWCQKTLRDNCTIITRDRKKKRADSIRHTRMYLLFEMSLADDY